MGIHRMRQRKSRVSPLLSRLACGQCPATVVFDSRNKPNLVYMTTDSHIMTMADTTQSNALRPATARGEATRQRILQAAEQEFGRESFFRASISEITRRAGIAQGTFYIYFKTKEDVLRELVRHMGRELRRTLTAAIDPGISRLEAERQGLAAFMRFVAEHENLYRVVQQAQFVDEEIYKAYYQDFARGYLDALQQAADSGEIRAGNLEVWVWILMGLSHFLGLRYGLWDSNGLDEAELDAAMEFIHNGMGTGPNRGGK